MDVPSAFSYDVFVSYAAADRWWVEGFLLPELGVPPDRTITRDQFDLGAPTLTEYERAVTASRHTIIVFSPAYLADEFATFAEVLTGHVAIVSQANRLLPLKLWPCTLPPRIALREVADCTRQEQWKIETERLRWVLQRPEPALQAIPCPYPGMRPFQKDQSACFYGRDAEIRQMEQHLRSQRRLFVIGPSGSGKSSLVFAGVVPRLEQSAYFAAGYWRIRTMRPGSEPTRALVELLAGARTDQAAAITTALAEPPAARRMLIIVDQFEEVFTQASREEQERFLNALDALTGYDNCAVIITMRADFYPNLMSSSLWPIDMSQRMEVAPLRGAALQAAIRQPAADVGVYLEPVLLNQLLNDAQNEPGVLPLIQETMQLLWTERRQKLLTLEAYEKLGRDGSSGLAAALATKADSAMVELPPPQRETARRIFLSLVQFGDGCPDTRRQLPLAELRREVGAMVEFNKTLEHLTANRLLIRDDEDQRHGAVVDLAHEALLTGWQRFKEWLVQDRADELRCRQLRQSVAAWRENRCDPSFLFGGSRLVDARRLVDGQPHKFDDEVRTFLQACGEYETNRARSSYLLQASGGAVGTGLGYGIAFSIMLLALGWPGRIPHWTALALTLVLMIIMGGIVGYCIGLGLWLFRDVPARRITAAGLMGALASGVAFASFTGFALDPQQQNYAVATLVGALLGGVIGVGAALDERRRLRLMLGAGGVCAALALFVLTMPVEFSYRPVTIVAGGVLALLAAIGFAVAAVDESTSAGGLGEAYGAVAK